MAIDEPRFWVAVGEAHVDARGLDEAQAVQIVLAAIDRLGHIRKLTAHLDSNVDGLYPELQARGWCKRAVAIMDSMAARDREQGGGVVDVRRLWAIKTPITCMGAGRVVLLGDAAHATTPFQGQGASMAFEDAVVLASIVRKRMRDDGDREDVWRADAIKSSVDTYQRLRAPRCSQMIRRSDTIGAPTHTRSKLRMGVLRL